MNYISHPVINSFTTAAAVTIGFGQVKVSAVSSASVPPDHWSCRGCLCSNNAAFSLSFVHHFSVFYHVEIVCKGNSHQNWFCPRRPTFLQQLKLWARSQDGAEVLLYVHRSRRFIRDGSPGRPPRLSHRSWALRSYDVAEVLLYVHGNRRFIRDGGPRRPPPFSHSFWALRSCDVVEVMLYVHRNRRFIRDGGPGRPPPLSHSPWCGSQGDVSTHILCLVSKRWCACAVWSSWDACYCCECNQSTQHYSCSSDCRLSIIPRELICM